MDAYNLSFYIDIYVTPFKPLKTHQNMKHCLDMNLSLFSSVYIIYIIL